VLAIAAQGLSPEQQATLFHPFPNPNSENRPQQGTGLGLSVVKAIVEAQGGQVGMHDRPGGGATFWFTLLKAATESNTQERLHEGVGRG
jgi:K+-sensing histidine kinase KdpD